MENVTENGKWNKEMENVAEDGKWKRNRTETGKCLWLCCVRI